MTARGPRAGTTLRLAATGGRADAMRIALTALSAAAATVLLLLTAAVASIGPGDGPYVLDVLNQPGLRPGVIVVLLLLCVPLLTLVGQCSRVGAPARDRRLSALRMAGATPREVRRIVAVETGLTAMAGALLGGVLTVVGRELFDSPVARVVKVQRPAPNSDGGTIIIERTKEAAFLLPADVSLQVWLVVLALALIPLGATLASLAALRRVSISPFGVIHRRVRRPPAVFPAILFLVGAVGLALWEPLSGWLGLSAKDGLGPYSAVALLLFVMALLGLVFGAASCAYLVGRLLAPRARRPAVLIAARRMVDAPFTASRATVAVVLAVLLGSAVQATRTAFLLMTNPEDRFFAETFDLLNVVLALGIGVAVVALLVIAGEGIIARRRTLAALSAAGTPRTVLRGAIVLETVLPLIPTVLLATAAGLFAGRGLFGTRVSPPGSYEALTVGSEASGDGVHTVDVPVPWAELAVLAGGTLVAVLLVTSLALVFLRRSTSVTELRAAA